jgi:hypothetical protein
MITLLTVSVIRCLLNKSAKNKIDRAVKESSFVILPASGAQSADKKRTAKNRFLRIDGSV